jgi:hypothetical protein
MKIRSPKNSGFGLVEIVVASAIIIIVGVSVTAAWQEYLKLIGKNSQSVQAALIIEEYGEAIHIFRDLSWANISNFSLNNPYYLYWDGTKYATSTSLQIVNGNYSVMATVRPIYRDANSNISESGILDNSTRNILLTVSSADGLQTFMQSEFLIHDIYKN